MYCLPEGTRSHYIQRRNVRQAEDRKNYDTKLGDLRNEAAARGILKSGMTYKAEWDTKAEFLDTLALGSVEVALETCKLYEVELTTARCACLENAASEFLGIQYGMQIQNKAKGILDVHIPNSAVQALSSRLHNKSFTVMSKIRVIIEEARVEDVKRRAKMKKEAEITPGNTNVQHVHQYGDNSVATQTGNVTINQYTVNDFKQLTVELDTLRTALKSQPTTLDADRTIGLLAEAEEASQQNDQTKVTSTLSRISKAGWEMIKTAAPNIGSQMLLHYLKLHGLA